MAHGTGDAIDIAADFSDRSGEGKDDSELTLRARAEGASLTMPSREEENERSELTDRRPSFRLPRLETVGGLRGGKRAGRLRCRGTESTTRTRPIRPAQQTVPTILTASGNIERQEQTLLAELSQLPQRDI